MTEQSTARTSVTGWNISCITPPYHWEVVPLLWSPDLPFLTETTAQFSLPSSVVPLWVQTGSKTETEINIGATLKFHKQNMTSNSTGVCVGLMSSQSTLCL